MAIQNVGLFSTSPPPLTKIIYVHETGRDHQQNRPRSLGPSSPQYRAEITTKQAEITTKQAEITTKQAEFTQAEIAKGRDHQVPTKILRLPTGSDLIRSHRISIAFCCELHLSASK